MFFFPFLLDFLLFNHSFLNLNLFFLLLKALFPSALNQSLALVLDSLYTLFSQHYTLKRNFLKSPRFFLSKGFELLVKFHKTLQTLNDFSWYLIL